MKPNINEAIDMTLADDWSRVPPALTPEVSGLIIEGMVSLPAMPKRPMEGLGKSVLPFPNTRNLWWCRAWAGIPAQHKSCDTKGQRLVSPEAFSIIKQTIINHETP